MDKTKIGKAASNPRAKDPRNPRPGDLVYRRGRGPVVVVEVRYDPETGFDLLFRDMFGQLVWGSCEDNLPEPEAVTEEDLDRKAAGRFKEILRGRERHGSN